MSDKDFNENNIEAYLHCGKCAEEWKSTPEIKTSQSPQQYSRVQVGWTKAGLQVWCFRHEMNIIHIDFEGAKHKADMTAKISDDDPRRKMK